MNIVNPFHKEGDGPLHRNQPATSYNHNQDEFAVELIRRWYDYWRERPGTGERVSSGGAKLSFLIAIPIIVVRKIIVVVV